jgi:hypothetical protein
MRGEVVLVTSERSGEGFAFIEPREVKRLRPAIFVQFGCPVIVTCAVINKSIKGIKINQRILVIGQTIDYVGIALQTVLIIDISFLGHILLPELGVGIYTLFLATVIAGLNGSGGHS